MRSDFLDVRALHEKYDFPHDGVSFAIEKLPTDLYEFRNTFLREELLEYREAWNKGDLVSAVDSLVDFVYVVFGTVLFMRAGNRALHRFPWPSFDSTWDHANTLGYLTPPTFGPPRLLNDGEHEILLHRLETELHGFSCAHHADTLNAVPFCLTHLWNAAYAGYLAAALMRTPWEPCWNLVHQANMQKVRTRHDGSDSKRNSPWDLIKPEGWVAPDAAIRLELRQKGAQV